MHYILSVWFVLDVLAILPFELFSIMWVNEWKYIPLFRLNRLIKFWKVSSHAMSAVHHGSLLMLSSLNPVWFVGHSILQKH